MVGKPSSRRTLDSGVGDGVGDGVGNGTGADVGDGVGMAMSHAHCMDGWGFVAVGSGCWNAPVHPVPLGTDKHSLGHTTRASAVSRSVNPVDTNCRLARGVGDAVANGVGDGVGMITSGGTTSRGLTSDTLNLR